jgi:hypothetical protein
MTIEEAWTSGITRLRRDPWASTEWLELLPSGDGYAPFGKLHSILNDPDVPDDIRMEPQDIPLWMIEDDGWDEYTD